MNAVFIIVAVVAILGLVLGLFGYNRLLTLHKLVAISGKNIDTDSLDTIYLTTIFVGIALFILCGMVSIGTWQSAEAKYKDCIDKTKNTAYCFKYLKD